MANPPIDKGASWDLQPICPEDFFQRLQNAMKQPEDYNHLLARTLNKICQAVVPDDIVWDDGVPYIHDPVRDKFISLHRATLTSGFYGRNGKDLYLRMNDVPTAGAQGFYCPRKATITGLWAKSRSGGSWILEVRKNGVPITLVSVTITGGKGGDKNTDIDVDAGDYLQFYLNGTGVAYPIGVVELAWRP
jgi:hypothetical protein